MLDNSVIKENLFNEFDKNNILKLVDSNKITFYLPDIVFFENFIPLAKKNYQKLVKLLDYCFTYCKKVFLPLQQIIEQEIKNPYENNYSYFYEANFIEQFKNDYTNSHVCWNMEKHQQDKNIIKDNYNKINHFILCNKEQIDKIQKKDDFSNFAQTIIKKYNLYEYSAIISNKVKGLSPKANAKEMYCVLVTYFLTEIMSKSFDTNYERLKTLFRKDNYFWIYYNTCFSTLTSPINKKNFHKDKTYLDNIYITYMKDLDILLSNDKKYMKDNFNTVYENSDKCILNFNDFMDYITNL